MEASAFAEEMCNELVSISAAQESPALILQGTDKKGQPFLDVLIECELKQVIFHIIFGKKTFFLYKLTARRLHNFFVLSKSKVQLTRLLSFMKWIYLVYNGPKTDYKRNRGIPKRSKVDQKDGPKLLKISIMDKNRKKF